MTVSSEQLKFGMFMFGVGVGIGEIREVSSGNGTRKGCVQFVEGDASSISILDAEFCNSNVENPAMLDLLYEVLRVEVLSKDQSLGR